MYKTLLGIYVLGGILIASGCSSSNADTSSTPAKHTETSGKPVTATARPSADASQKPDVTITAPSDLAKIKKDNEGKVLVFNFWATWCPPCVAETPQFVDYYSRMDKSKVAFISLSADDPDTIDKVKKFMDDKKILFPVHVLKGTVEETNKAIGFDLTGALPTTVVFDKTGKAVKDWTGGIELKDIEAVVAPLL